MLRAGNGHLLKPDEGFSQFGGFILGPKKMFSALIDPVRYKNDCVTRFILIT
jgi:hypothetical protein